VSPFLLGFTLVVTTLIGLGLRRVYHGPTVFDRLVAVALVTVNGVVVLVLLGFLFDRAVFFLDIALAYALLAFILPIAVSRYFEQRQEGVEVSPRVPVDRGGTPQPTPLEGVPEDEHDRNDEHDAHDAQVGDDPSPGPEDAR
jgi:multicomponent Na+:H+ antiporter subunit F